MVTILCFQHGSIFTISSMNWKLQASVKSEFHENHKKWVEIEWNIKNMMMVTNSTFTKVIYI